MQKNQKSQAAIGSEQAEARRPQSLICVKKSRRRRPQNSLILFQRWTETENSESMNRDGPCVGSQLGCRGVTVVSMIVTLPPACHQRRRRRTWKKMTSALVTVRGHKLCELKFEGRTETRRAKPSCIVFNALDWTRDRREVDSQGQGLGSTAHQVWGAGDKSTGSVHSRTSNADL